jgi:hypothetical protein
VPEPAQSASWTLTGEAIVTVVGRRGRVLGDLPAGVAPVPGPGVLIAVRYQASPIGPFTELNLLEPGRLGGRPGWCTTLSVVNDARARTVGRQAWGIPRQLGVLAWASDGATCELSWPEGDLTVTAERRRGTWPFLVSMRILQRRSDGHVGVPVRTWGLAHRAAVKVAGGAGPFAPVAGHHIGVLAAGQRIHMRPAVLPVGLTRALVAPLHAPEPALAGPGGVPAAAGVHYIEPARAYGSVG